MACYCEVANVYKWCCWPLISSLAAQQNIGGQVWPPQVGDILLYQTKFGTTASLSCLNNGFAARKTHILIVTRSIRHTVTVN